MLSFLKGNDVQQTIELEYAEISKCENFDEYSNDKHYYTGTNEYYLWKRDSIERACKLGSGTYYDIKKSTE
jgi:hypothetical protein